jgi:hypothetical protein
METIKMINEYVSDIARQTGLPVVSVSIVEGKTVGCNDTHLLLISFKSQTVSALVYQSELDDLQKSGKNDRLVLKVKAALGRLKY